MFVHAEEAGDLLQRVPMRRVLIASLWRIRTPTVANPPDITAISGKLMVWARAVGPGWT
jgi:hypothetical protein